eukprot:TRINITY_DN922_c2_g1_i3.p1 TRINITY_DN922_c2_g1~~TRINITY_DN922_c2_g1_i3.p1  ORF type:complete len:325 (-),score=74.55 TRINITY_DN922_c2_g1_i3:118-1092(-)
MPPGRVCGRCSSSDIETDSTNGYAVCTVCGCVLEENTIVSEVTFVENASGSSSVVGQFVPTTGRRPYRKGVTGFHKESREVTIENGRRRIAQLASSLGLKAHHVEAAKRLFMLAVQHNFTQGRRTPHVVCACLYVVCRREKTPHLLIDFSDVLQTNVYVLGHTFLRFCRLLNLQLPLIDPSLFIPRFASKLEFEDKATLVSNTALRIVSRMGRDWIQTGRRPSGICGASLLIAARLHGFRRTQKEIIRIVRIGDMTLSKRLSEFQNTPTCRNLTYSEFLEDENAEPAADPPAFIVAKNKEENTAKQKKLNRLRKALKRDRKSVV